MGFLPFYPQQFFTCASDTSDFQPLLLERMTELLSRLTKALHCDTPDRVTTAD